MSKFKIGLIVMVAGVIIAGIFFWIQSIQPPTEIKPPENRFIKKIESEIDYIKFKPNNKFCKDYYELILFHISQFHSQKKFSANESDNNQWKDIFEKNLYSEYADKFIKQTKHVLQGSDWKSEDLKFIQSEKNQLSKSSLFVKGGNIEKELNRIQSALNKYNEIVSFIASCKSFTFPFNGKLDDRFPIHITQSKISRANQYLKRQMENAYVNKCKRLHIDLKAIPNLLFKMHVSYLDNKIKYWLNTFPNYSSYTDYSRIIYQPIKAEIEALDSDVYTLPNFESEFSKLETKWNIENKAAYIYKYK